MGMIFLLFVDAVIVGMFALAVLFGVVAGALWLLTTVWEFLEGKPVLSPAKPRKAAYRPQHTFFPAPRKSS